MIIIIGIILIGIVLGLLLEALFLYSTTSIFKINDAPYRKAFKVSFNFLMWAIFLSLFISPLFKVIDIVFKSSIIVTTIENTSLIIIGFFVANSLYKKYYQTDFRNNLKIYAVKTVLSIMATLVIAFLIVIPIRKFIVQPFFVQGATMEPNFKNGEYMLIKEYDKNYKRGEVVVFKYPKDEKQFFIKRIIGMPGEKIEIEQSVVYIDGNVLDESLYLNKNIITNGDAEVTLGSDEYFVMGDNRQHSHDSRTWGVLNKNLIIGKYWISINALSKK